MSTAIAPFGINPNPKTKAEQYWNVVHQQGNELSRDGETVFLTSIEDRVSGVRGGRTFETDLRTAAQRIVERTHRKSTPEEIHDYHQADRLEAARLAEIEEKRKEKSILKPSQEQIQSQADMTGAVVESVLVRVLAALDKQGTLARQQKEK